MKLSRGYRNDLPLHLVAGLDGATETALSHPLRREILRRLNSEPKTAVSPSGLAKSLPFRTTISNLSYHANVLVKCRIAESEPDSAADSPWDAMYRTLVNGDTTIRNVLEQMKPRDAQLSREHGPEGLHR